MQNYRFICTALVLHITIASFAGHKRAHPDDQESFKSTKRARTGATQHDLNKELLAAARKNQWKVVYALLRLGANIDTKDVKGWTPLHFAAIKNRVKAIKILVKHGANIEAITQKGSTPLHIAARNNHPQAITTLLKHGANIEATTHYGTTPLHIAAGYNHPQAITTLLKHGANIEATALYGTTPLHHATNHGHSQAAEALIQHGAHPIPHAKNAPLQLYYNYQVRNQKTTAATPFLQYLIEVSLDATADNGNTILHHLLPQKINDFNLFFHILHHPSFTKFNAEHKNMLGLNVLHMCAAFNPSLLESLFYTLTSGKTSEEIKRLTKATTPYGDTMYSLMGYLSSVLHNSWTPLMNLTFLTGSLTAQSKMQLEQRLKNTDDPAYVTDRYDSALSVARCEEVKNMIREDIRQKRRAQVSTYLMDEHQQPKVLADLQLQFAGTYEPSQ